MICKQEPSVNQKINKVVFFTLTSFMVNTIVAVSDEGLIDSTLTSIYESRSRGLIWICTVLVKKD